MSKKLTISEIKRRIKKYHNDMVIIDDSTFKSIREKARFIDKEFGEWYTSVYSVINGRGHPIRGNKKRGLSNTVSLNSVKARIMKIHGSDIQIVDESYTKISERAKFIDRKYNIEWTASVNDVLRGSSNYKRAGIKREQTIKSYKNKILKKRRMTNMKKYGGPAPACNFEIAMKSSIKTNQVYRVLNFEDNSVSICLGSYEAAFAIFLNKNKIKYQKEPKTFKLSNGTYYTPDFYLKEYNIWIEVKGRFIGDALEKWSLFSSEYKNSELLKKEDLKSLGIEFKRNMPVLDGAYILKAG